MRVSRILAASISAVATLAASTARAQSVRGTVVDPGGHPVAGVVLLLVDSVSSSMARALSSPSGEFRLTAPRPGTYRLRTLRIGYRPVVSPPFALAAGADRIERVVVTGLPLGLDTVRVASQNVCRAFTDSGAATFAVWDQVRTALTAAELTASGRTFMATTLTYERAFDPSAGRPPGRVVHEQANVSTDYVRQAWRSPPPDSLHGAGYVVTDRDNTVTYYAPSLEMLLSPLFVEDHCFKLITDRKQPSLVGIAFSPTPQRMKGAPEVRGTLWVDRATSELRRLDFGYAYLLRLQEDVAGGSVTFTRLRDGTWAISQWAIRMPVLEETVRPGHGAELILSQLRENGGELVLARQGTDTLWARPPFTLRGVLRDSVSGTTVPGARITISDTPFQATTDARGQFTIHDLLPGNYVAEIRTAALDSLLTVNRRPFTFLDTASALELEIPSAQAIATLLCGKRGTAAAGGIVVGMLRVRGDSAGSALRNARVVAEWPANPMDTSAAAAMRMRRLEVRASPAGDFRFCGVPVNTAITVRASADGAESPEPDAVRIQPGSRLVRATFTLESTSALAARGATFTGVVVSDSTHEPIVAADVSLTDLGKTTVTDARGAFRLTGITAGEHQVTVRRIGYGAADTKVAFAGHETVERRVVLGRAVELEPVVVSDRAVDRYMPGFEDHRRVGLGHFMTRPEIAKFDGMFLSSALRGLPGLGIARNPKWNGPEYVVGSHAPPPACPDRGFDDCVRSHGFYVGPDGPIECYAQVYIDGVLQNGIREPTEPFDIHTISPERVQAMEYYSGPAQTPSRYSRMGSKCGVLVIWLRRD